MNRLLSVIPILFLFASCKSDDSNEDKYYNTITKKYYKTFVDNFGEFSMSHTWSTCETKKLDVSIDEAKATRIKVFKDDPTLSSRSYILADQVVTSFTFDAPIAMNEVYVSVELESGETLLKKVESSNSVFSANLSKTDVCDKEISEGVPMQYFIAYDGIGAVDDFDYNDVVLSVFRVSGRKSTTFAVFAVGCTSSVEAFFLGEVTEKYLFHELHTTMYSSERTMVNTISPENRVSRKEMLRLAVQNTFDIDESISLNDIVKRIAIKSGDLEIRYKSDKNDNAPMVLIVADPEWEWPSEHVSIDVAYPEFKNYVNSEREFANWYEK